MTINGLHSFNSLLLTNGALLTHLPWAAANAVAVFSPENLSPMSDGEQANDLIGGIRTIDDAIIANADAVTRSKGHKVKGSRGVSPGRRGKVKGSVRADWEKS